MDPSLALAFLLRGEGDVDTFFRTFAPPDSPADGRTALFGVADKAPTYIQVLFPPRGMQQVTHCALFVLSIRCLPYGVRNAATQGLTGLPRGGDLCLR
jgi:hypothetical protein